MAKRFDVVIVGAGPAGLMAARAAGEQGLTAALLERKNDIPKIHRSCGGVLNVNEPTFGEVVTFDEDKKEIELTRLDVRIPYDGPHQDVYGFHLYAPGGGRLEFGDFSEIRKDPRNGRLGVSVSKEQLLRELLDEAARRGVQVFADTNVASVRTGAAGPVVECDDGREFEAAFVVAADGINSRIARSLGLNRDRDFYGTSRDTSALVRGTACPDPEGFLFMVTPRGIYSMIPVAEKDCYHIYASTYRRDQRPPDMLEYFLHESPTFSAWYRDSEVLAHRTACIVNLMSPLEKPFKDNVLFVGDACWRREMSNVGSMCSGWKAMTIIAQALGAGRADESGLEEYFAWYQENYYGPQGGRKQGGRDFTQYLTPEDIDYLVSLPDERFPQTMDIFKVVNCIGRAYGDLMTRIYEERPDVMDRMIQVRENMDDDMQQRISWGFRNI